MRSKRKGSSTPRAFLVGLGIPALALFAVFSLISYDRMTADWPLGISSEEVHLYQHWFDQRPDTMAEVEVLRFDLDSSGPCGESAGGKAWRRFNTVGYADSALVSRLDDGWMLTLRDERPYQGQHAMVLRPAGLSSIRCLYAREVARHLGVTHGSARLVRLWSCGDDAGLFLAEEAVTDRYVDEHGTPGSVLVDSLAMSNADSMAVKEALRSATALIAEGDLNRMDGKSATVWALVSEAAGLDMRQHAAMWFEPAGRIFVTALINAGQGEAPGGTAQRTLTAYLSVPQVKEAVRSLAEELRKDSTALADLLAEVDAQNASAFVGDTRIGYVRAQLGQERKEFLRRLLHSAMEGNGGSAMAEAERKAAPGGELDPFLRRYLVGDTIRIPRAKHLIDHVITVPPGYGLVLEKGARLNMAPGAGLVVNGALHMRGTGLNPVFIRPTDDGVPWAGIRVNGRDGTRCVISGLKMSGGSTLPSDDGAGASMLSFVDCDVSLAKSSITDARGPAMVSATRGALAMEECYLSTGSDALVDLAFTTARFKGCSFLGTASKGLRLKATVAQATDCGFTRFSFVGLSAGLKSKVLLERCSFLENGTAVVLADGALGYSDGCAFKGNTVAFDLHCNKPGLGGGQVTSYQSTFEANGTDHRADARSSWKEGVRPGSEAFSSAGGAD